MWKIFHYFIDILIKPKKGLGKRIFLILSQLTPITNVELIIKTIHNKSLLIFRDDEFYGPGWHLPGGILRFKEKSRTRIIKTIENEIGVLSPKIQDIKLMGVYEIVNLKMIVRSHFISLIFKVNLEENTLNFKDFNPNKEYKNGDVAAHTDSPNNLIKEHLKYKDLIDESLFGNESRKYNIAYDYHEIC
ncbi:MULTISPECIES: NUDIX hydrolase [Prochlorococcus]|uniref:Nudix hydrolase domain-containing protein n=1 Tax=Prochlorococcus marinus str. MIT 9116 TaxID=167544 RepID=A0A0A1ZY67_PROMR|nr:hypothetical protein [Prochlorococcus marinus]KGF91726.1 hypothetical protein EU92_0471 [Prochlorococcus marinus str. MIT 9107]KGF93088.1 hypothetical protein EU93_0263 [Prochlorococcus marinus str. MIT 9116]KGF95091.1 hypothetical protein EU94_0389 [Prochlorococcus marinus str. MIT 9123]